jgi:hypothetical protein
MPWLTLWVDPVPFTTHDGVTVYHTYNDMEARRGFHRFRFTTAASDADIRFHFDVRELPLASTARLSKLDQGAGLAVEQAIIRDIIHEAIDGGLLREDSAVAPGHLVTH